MTALDAMTIRLHLRVMHVLGWVRTAPGPGRIADYRRVPQRRSSA
jgi:hypothetical protein